MNHWLITVSGKTWHDFVEAGAADIGFKDGRWKQVQKIKSGDVLLCCLSGVQRFVGLLEVTSDAFRQDADAGQMPARLPVRPVVTLTPQTAVPVNVLRGQLSAFKDLKTPLAWMDQFRGTPLKWRKEDAEAVATALRDARANPVARNVDPEALDCRPPAAQTPRGLVAIPPATPSATSGSPWTRDDRKALDEAKAVLAKLGAGLGLDVWIAPAARERQVGGTRLGDFARVNEQWTVAMDDASARTAAAIDVLWTRGKALVAGFVVADAASAASRLLRAADLVALQPELNVPLYVVAPGQDRLATLIEINRPCFRLASLPLTQLCRFIAVEELHRKFEQVAALLGYLKPEFLDEISESCQLDEE